MTDAPAELSPEDAAAEALRQHSQGGKQLRPWAQLPSATKERWREPARDAIAAWNTRAPRPADPAADKLREPLTKLANEAAGFLSMADPVFHGETNLAALNFRIKEAREALAPSPPAVVDYRRGAQPVVPRDCDWILPAGEGS